MPWSTGYVEFRNRYIATVLSNPLLLDAFRKGTDLPVGYGLGLDERCVEYPWLLATLPRYGARVLDAGSILNFEHILDSPIIRNKSLHLLTLAPEGECYWTRGISYLYSDLRHLPYRDGYFDWIVCGSTLEHVGFDNSAYSSDLSPSKTEFDPMSFTKAIQELRRVLKPGGTLLVTVPFGRHHRYRSFQIFDRALLTDAAAAFGRTSKISERFFRYTPNGWVGSSATVCANCAYNHPPIAPGGRVVHGNSRTKHARTAAAEAVACIELAKQS